MASLSSIPSLMLGTGVDRALSRGARPSESDVGDACAGVMVHCSWPELPGAGRGTPLQHVQNND